MATPFLLAETPRGGPFGHRFIVPPETDLLSTDVEAFFQRAAQGRGNNFIAVNHQVEQHLPNGAVREGAETLLLAGVETGAMSDEQMNQIRQTLNKRLNDLEKLVTNEINWQESGQQTVIIRGELADWLRGDIADTLAAQSAPPPPMASSDAIRPKNDQSAMLFGMLLGLVVGAAILFIWFF